MADETATTGAVRRSHHGPNEKNRPNHLVIQVYGCPQLQQRWWGREGENPPKLPDGNVWLLLGMTTLSAESLRTTMKLSSDRPR